MLRANEGVPHPLFHALLLTFDNADRVPASIVHPLRKVGPYTLQALEDDLSLDVMQNGIIESPRLRWAKTNTVQIAANGTRGLLNLRRHLYFCSLVTPSHVVKHWPLHSCHNLGITSSASLSLVIAWV